MQNTSPKWKWLWADGGKNLPPSDYSGAVASFDNPGYSYPKDITVDITHVQSGSGDPSPTNVRPISGWTGAKVMRTGKNLFDDDANTTFEFLLPAGTYYAKRFRIGDSSTEVNSRFEILIDNVWTVVVRKSLDNGNITLTGDLGWGASPEQTISLQKSYKLRMPLSTIKGYRGKANVILACETMPTEYVPYNGSTYSITFPSEAGTVYGGTLDVTKGALVVEYAKRTFNGTQNITKNTDSEMRYYNADIADGDFVSDKNVVSSWLKNSPTTADTNPSFHQSYRTGNHNIYFENLNKIDATLVTVDAVKAYFANNPLEVVYKLATPITYQLTPTQIALLAGVNNVWADCGDIAVSLESPMDVKLEAEAIIAGVEYTDISAPVINRALMQNGLTVGNAVACTCSFTVRGAGTIPRSAEVIIKERLTDGTQTSEWLNAGTFYVSRRKKDAVTGYVDLECYDAMLKANATYEASGAWPRAMADVVTEIAALLGVAIDPRTQIHTGSAYMVSLPEAWATINNILADIATAHGGNWIITPAGMLRLVPTTSASGAASAAEAVEVEGIIGSLTVGATQEVTGIRVAGDDGDALIGDESGLVVSIDSPYVNETSAAALGVMLIGQTYQSYTMTQAVYDPAAELGDYLRGGAEDEVNSVLYGEVATLGAAYRANITALEVAEIADEYPYIGGNEAVAEQVRRLSSVVADKASIEDLEAVDARLDNLSASDIKAGIIHSADYETVVIPLIYPASDLYPAADLYPNYGERVIRGFAIDFATGQIYGAFYSTQIEQLQEAVEALQNSLVYPKAETTTLSHMELYPYNLASVKTAMKKKEDEE